jgi:hypothetical protein
MLAEHRRAYERIAAARTPASPPVSGVDMPEEITARFTSGVQADRGVASAPLRLSAPDSTSWRLG